MLKDKSNLPTAEGGQFPIRAVVNVGVSVQHLPGGRRVQPADDMQQRTFPAAGRPHDGDKITGTDLHVGVVQCRDPAFPYAVDLGNVFDLNVHKKHSPYRFDRESVAGISQKTLKCYEIFREAQATAPLSFLSVREPPCLRQSRSQKYRSPRFQSSRSRC